MALFDEEERRKEIERKKKTKRLVLTGIVLTVVLIIALIVAIAYLVYNPNRITVFYDGKESPNIESLLTTKKADNGTTEIYIPIKDIASFFKYDSNNGKYTTSFEDENSCYVQTDKEVIVFSLDSDIITKIDKSTQNEEYETIKIDYPITKINDKLYMNIYVLRDAFNMYVSNFNEKTKKLEILTLDKILERYTNVVKKNEYKDIDKTFANQKAILKGWLVVISVDGKMGVIDVNGSKKIGTQYEKITYIPSKEIFLVQINGKLGICEIDEEDGVKELITPQYDELTLIDSENDLYVAKRNGRYGVIDINGVEKIYLDYDGIGVDINSFKDNGLKSGYVLLDKLIPVKQNNKWIFFVIEETKNLDGTKNIECKQINTLFDEIGCIAKTNKRTVSNLMVLQKYELVVVRKNKFYGIMDTKGRAVLHPKYSDVYIDTASGETNYYVVDSTDGVTYNLIEELQKAGYKIEQ